MNKICQIRLRLLLLMMLPLFAACDKMVYEDLEECPQGVHVSFYHQTPCMEAPAEVGVVDGLRLFAFDLHDVLVKVEEVSGKVDLIKSYKVELPPVEQGQYSFIAWGGVSDKHFDVENFVVGQTTKKEVMMKLKASNGTAAQLLDHKVWQGESQVIALPDRKTHGTVYAEVAINMLEVTNRIRVTLKLHESVREEMRLEDFELTLSSANGTYLINRRMPLKTESLIYPAIENEKAEAYTIDRLYTLMELKSGYNNVIRLYNKKAQEDFLLQDLLGKVILENPNVNLECTHDFDVVIEVEDKCKSCPDNNLVVHIIINNYRIHSFAVKLGNRY